MKEWIMQLMQRNALLFWYGTLCIIAGFICSILIKTTTIQVNNISAWLKPMKFFFSVAIFCFTMAWLMYELPTINVNAFSIMVVLVMTLELVVITWQAANGRLSHFNVSTPLYASLFTIMGIAISILTLWTGFIGFQFCISDTSHIEKGYLWGIRLGILLFVIFSFEGGIMGVKLAHTVGAADGSDGIAIVNWSKHFGDLRIAHFFGIHALQLLPIIGFYILKQPSTIISFSVVYAALVTFFLVQALKGLPIFK